MSNPLPRVLLHGRTTGNANVAVQVDASGVVQTSASFSSTGAAIQDGVSSSIKATVKNYTNSKPLAAVLVDTNGDAYTAGTAASQTLDFDTGAGSATTPIVGIALPASGGPVAGGTATNPLTVTSTNLPTTVDTNSGNKSASTLRVVLATDQPALTNKLLVTPDLPSGASTAAKQPALGTAGTASTDVLTIQGIASMTKLLVTPDSVALPANQSVNIAQVNGTTTVNGGSAAGIVAVGGPNATNVAITGNPVNNGAQAVSSENAAVTTARQVQLVADLVGKLIVLPYANPENFVTGSVTSAMTGTTSTSCLAAPASGLRNYITSITVSNGSTTVPTDILIQDGSGGTTIRLVPCPIGTGTGTGTSGGHFVFPTPIRQPTTATAIYVANVTTGSSTKISIDGYKGV